MKKKKREWKENQDHSKGNWQLLYLPGTAQTATCYLGFLQNLKNMLFTAFQNYP